jgi:hypothetical protein
VRVNANTATAPMDVGVAGIAGVVGDITKMYLRAITSGKSSKRSQMLSEGLLTIPRIWRRLLNENKALPFAEVNH